MTVRRWTRLTMIFFFAALTLVGPASGQQENKSLPSAEQVDEYIENGMTELNTPGAAVALIKNGKITHLKGFGRIEETGAPVTPQTPFQIASMTKSFTSLVVLQLANEGLLSIDDPVVKYIPYFRTSDSHISDTITIRQLMNHRSGISTLDGNRYQRTTYRGKDALEQAVGMLSRAHLETLPGKRFHYSNANYAVLADLIEVVDKTTFEKALEARVFSRIGMINTYVQVPTRPVEPEAKGNLQWFGIPIESHFIAGRMMMGAGGVTTSAEDLAKYMIAISRNDPRIVPPALSDSWTRARRIGYEFGWEHDEYDGQPVIFHNGENPGFRSIMMYAPKSGRGALFLTNMSGTLQGNLPVGAVRYSLGLPATSISPSELFAGLLWGSLALLAALAAGCVFSISRLRKNVLKPWKRSSQMRFTIMVLPNIFLLAFAFIMLFYVPRSFGVDFSAASLFNPDLGVLLLALATIAVVWAIARSVLLYRRTS